MRDFYRNKIDKLFIDKLISENVYENSKLVLDCIDDEYVDIIDDMYVYQSGTLGIEFLYNHIYLFLEIGYRSIGYFSDNSIFVDELFTDVNNIEETSRILNKDLEILYKKSEK